MLKDGVPANTVIYNTVINACAKNGRLERAETWLQRLASEPRLQPDVISYNTLVGACAKAGDAQMAEKWMTRMVEAGLQPNRVTYLVVLQQHSRAGRPRNVERLLEKMVDAGLRPCEKCRTALVLAYAHSTQAERPGADEISARFQRISNASSRTPSEVPWRRAEGLQGLGAGRGGVTAPSDRDADQGGQLARTSTDVLRPSNKGSLLARTSAGGLRPNKGGSLLAKVSSDGLRPRHSAGGPPGL